MRRILLVGSRKLRTVAVVALGVGALVIPAPAALADPPAAPPRADAYVEVWCRAPDGTVAPYERVDAHSVDQGNKDVQVDAYVMHGLNRNTPGLSLGFGLSFRR